MLEPIQQICPRCRTRRLKNWNELTADEKFIIERMPESEKFSKAERKNHLFCLNCRNEVSQTETRA